MLEDQVAQGIKLGAVSVGERLLLALQEDQRSLRPRSVLLCFFDLSIATCLSKNSLKFRSVLGGLLHHRRGIAEHLQYANQLQWVDRLNLGIILGLFEKILGYLLELIVDLTILWRPVYVDSLFLHLWEELGDIWMILISLVGNVLDLQTHQIEILEPYQLVIRIATSTVLHFPSFNRWPHERVEQSDLVEQTFGRILDRGSR